MLLSISDYNRLRDRALSLKNSKDTSYKRLLQIKDTLEKYSNQLKIAKEDKLIQEAAMKILKEVIDDLSKEFINSIVELLTYALQTIFFDEDYSIEIEIKETKLGNNANFILVDNKTGIRSDINNTGGGIRAVLGFTLQVFCIMTYKRNRILFMDESLSAVSTKYVEPLMMFIKQLAEERDFIFIGIIHDPRFRPYADYTYKMTKGKLELIAKDGEDVE